MTDGLHSEIRTSEFALPRIPAGQEPILGQEAGKKRWVQLVTEPRGNDRINRKTKWGALEALRHQAFIIELRSCHSF